jgi:hypothetical protein
MNEASATCCCCAGCCAGIAVAITAMFPGMNLRRLTFALVLGTFVGVGIAYAIMM